MIAGFYVHLIYNGVSTKDITVLTFYNGQRKLILKKLRFHHLLQGLLHSVRTVDSYQGNEYKSSFL